MIFLLHSMGSFITLNNNHFTFFSPSNFISSVNLFEIIDQNIRGWDRGYPISLGGKVNFSVHCPPSKFTLLNKAFPYPPTRNVEYFLGNRFFCYKPSKCLGSSWAIMPLELLKDALDDGKPCCPSKRQ